MRHLGVLVRTNYASLKGYVRALLSELELITGSIDHFVCTDLSRVRRLVFVCLGNINRSAFADAVSAANCINSTSFGISTTTGTAAFYRAIKIAAEMGCNLGSHNATSIADFTPEFGDLYLVMEIRHA